MSDPSPIMQDVIERYGREVFDAALRSESFAHFRVEFVPILLGLLKDVPGLVFTTDRQVEIQELMRVYKMIADLVRQEFGVRATDALGVVLKLVDEQDPAVLAAAGSVRADPALVQRAQQTVVVIEMYYERPTRENARCRLEVHLQRDGKLVRQRVEWDTTRDYLPADVREGFLKTDDSEVRFRLYPRSA